MKPGAYGGVRLLCLRGEIVEEGRKRLGDRTFNSPRTCSSGKVLFRDAWLAQLALIRIKLEDLPPAPGHQNACAFYRCSECKVYHLTSKGYGDSFVIDERRI